MPVRWVRACVDVPAGRVDAAGASWSAVTGRLRRARARADDVVLGRPTVRGAAHDGTARAGLG